ncbi:hypothetical protein [Rhodoferax sp.]|uniref:hypothetical protein n=1 Tax=Rhodoferax sp. TaxID=50421 RepID=UPI00374D334C
MQKTTDVNKRLFCKAMGVAYLAPGRFVQELPLTWRGVGQAMSLAVQGFNGGATWSQTLRSRHISNIKISRVRAVIQCTYPTGRPIRDTYFSDNYDFQIGLETNYAKAVTAIAPRAMFTFGGSETVHYVAASPPAGKFIVSDILDLGEGIPAGQFFGLWTTVENPERQSNKMPYTRSTSNFLERYVGAITNQATQVSQIASGAAKTATSVTKATNAKAGVSNYFTPVMLLVETDSSLPFVYNLSDSIGYGVGEGVNGSGTDGDGLGSAQSNMGIMERAVHEMLGYNLVNAAKGSDRLEYLADSTNWDARRTLLKMGNFTHVILGDVHNDMYVATSVSKWVSGGTYPKWSVVSANSNHYIATTGGTAGATAPGGAESVIADNTVVWAFMQVVPALSTARASSLIIARMASVVEQIKFAVPGIKVIAMTSTPDAASNNGWIDAIGQSPATYWGDATSRRAVVDSLIRAKPAYLGIDSYFEPAAALEDSYPVVTSKWISNGTANLVTNDQTHPNSHGYKLAAATLTADKFV